MLIHVGLRRVLGFHDLMSRLWAALFVDTDEHSYELRKASVFRSSFGSEALQFEFGDDENKCLKFA